MPKDKEYKLSIPKIYKKNYEDIGLLFWVYAQKRIMSGISIRQSIELYMDFADISKEDFSIETGMQIWQRLNADYLDSCKSCKDCNCNNKL